MFVSSLRTRSRSEEVFLPRPSSLVPASLTQLHAREHPRLQLAVAIGELGFDRERTRGRIDNAADHGDFALENIARIRVDDGLHILALMKVRDLFFRNAETKLERRGLHDHERDGGI